MLRSVPLLAALAAVSLVAQTPTQTPSALDKATLEKFVRHMYAWPQQVQVKIGDPKPASLLPGYQEIVVTASAGQASQAFTYFVSSDGQRIIQGQVFDVQKNPFAADRDRIVTNLQPSFGEPGAPVVVVIYSDFQCSFCRSEAKVIREQLRKQFPDQIRVYNKDFPLEQIHPWAKPAAIAGRCVFRQKPAMFWDFHDWIFENQGQITPENLNSKVAEWSKDEGLEPLQLSSCIESRATEAEVNKSMAEARALDVNSTPTLFVNGRRVVGQVPFEQLRSIINHEIEYAKTHGGGEKCCELKVPLPGAPAK